MIKVLGPVNSNGENSGRDTHRFSETNHGEAGAVEGGQYVVHTGGKGSMGGSKNSARKKLHWTKTRGSGTVGDTVANIRGLCKGDEVLGGRA